ncbi:ankyrin repeat, SAM and basic leucine zipper domain-containing protein 1 isoform X3 [Podarcis muralis]|uniref:Ankyrin repeat, SAM and basic leucine zipper domain-containing protein 1 n=1 Tax=Podarcis muralis TaxID=64176 RepID=A0A670IVP6_PODMU|nr:ankyrin repeat, SAM and basic leucine zipper domain-containing protein 1 isoform X3 [Podarcis muralis]
MASGVFSLAVPAGEESSESDDDGWVVGSVEAARQKHQLDDILQSNDKDEALKKALLAGNLPAIEELLNSGVSVDSTFKFGWTPLMYAASVSNVELMQILLNRGSNASFDKDQYTVLMAACTAHTSEEQILKCVELLLSRNANPNAACRKKMTPLMYAAREGHPQVVTLLAAHGSEINAQDERGYTLFSLLSLSKHPFQERFNNLTKEEAIHKLLKAIPNTFKNQKTSSYSAFGDLEVFLQGLELEHLTEVLKEGEIGLRELWTMEKKDFTQLGITNTRDQQKILGAAKEVQIEKVKLEELSSVVNLEFSGDEFLCFLVKLNKQCMHLTAAVQSAVNQFPTDAHKLVLEWSPPQKLANVCGKLVSSAEDLTGEATKLKSLMEKLHDGQKDDHCRIQPCVEKRWWKKPFVQIVAVTLVGSGCAIFIMKLTLRKS